MTEYSPEPSGHPLSLDKKISRVLHGLTNRPLVSAKPKSDELEISGEALGNAIWAWQQRTCYLPGELFSDPAGACSSRSCKPRSTNDEQPFPGYARHRVFRPPAPSAG